MRSKTPTLPESERFVPPTKPCRNGHMAPRYARGNACTECVKERFQQNKEQFAEQKRHRRARRTPEEIERDRKYMRIWMHHKRTGTLHVEELEAARVPHIDFNEPTEEPV